LAITPMHAFSDEVILTAFLLFGIFAITEQFNEMAPQANFGAVMIGFLVAILGSSMGYLEAWAMNPARDLGPRLFAYFAGWGSSALPSPDNYWWVDWRRDRRRRLPTVDSPLPAGTRACFGSGTQEIGPCYAIYQRASC